MVDKLSVKGPVPHLCNYLNRYKLSPWLTKKNRSEAVFVLHCFQKKSKSGITIPKADMDIIRARLKVAKALAQELRNAKTNH